MEIKKTAAIAALLTAAQASAHATLPEGPLRELAHQQSLEASNDNQNLLMNSGLDSNNSVEGLEKLFTDHSLSWAPGCQALPFCN